MELLPRKPEGILGLWAKKSRKGHVISETKQIVIGSGFECLVLSNPNSPETVIAYHFGLRGMDHQKAVYQAKTMFYIHRFYSTLFPHNFPRFHAVYRTKNANDVITSIRRKIDEHEREFDVAESTLMNVEKATLATVLDVDARKSQEKKVQYPFANVRKKMQAMKLSPTYDIEPRNYVLGKDGGEYYIDTIWAPFSEDHYNEEDIEKSMTQNGYSIYDIKIALSCIRRWKQLRKEYQKSLEEIEKSKSQMAINESEA